MKLLKRLTAVGVMIGIAATLTVTANAGQHTATRCSYPTSPTYVTCTQVCQYKTARTKPRWWTNDAPYWGSDLADWDCEWCGEKAAYYVAYPYCNKCLYYSTSYEDTADHVCCEWMYLCRSCLSDLNRTERENDTHYHEKWTLQDGYPEPTIETEGKPCTTHTAYANRTHYYCNTHGYVGTSSICTYTDVSVNPSPKSMQLSVGQSSAITPNATSGSTVYYTSNKTSVATVSSTGSVTAIAPGSATVIVKASL